MTPTQERLQGIFIGVAIITALVLVASPFLNWLAGYGFTWYF